MPKGHARRDFGIFLLSVGILLLQICLTKIFSFMLWYHFGFLAISSALLGFSASGVYLTLFPGVLKRNPLRALGVLAILGAACFPESQGAQFAGATAGLGTGMAASVAVAKRFGRRRQPESKAAEGI